MMIIINAYITVQHSKDFFRLKKEGRNISTFLKDIPCLITSILVLFLSVRINENPISFAATNK